MAMIYRAIVVFSLASWLSLTVPAFAAQISVGGGAVTGNPVTDNPVMIGVSDGTNSRIAAGDSAGRQAVIGGAAEGSATAGNPVSIAGTDGSNARVPLVNAQRQIYVNVENQKASFQASFLNFTPAATATDFFAICGSAGKTIRVQKLWIDGTATAATTVDIVVKFRSSVDSSGTPTTLSTVQMDQNDAAVTAGPASSPAGPVIYTVNPTLGSDGHNWDNQKLFLPPTSSSPTAPPMYTFEPGRNFSKDVVLRGTAQCLVLNWNSQVVPTGAVLDGGVLWTEE